MELFIIEPYYGGSHKYWADNLRNKLPYNVSLFKLPARFWKWRMQGAAITLADNINNAAVSPDCIIISDMIDLPTFKSLLKYKSVPILLYMHENQFTYPKSVADKEKHFDLTYGYLNYKSALVADSVIFNTHFHKTQFLNACTDLLHKMPDFQNTDTITAIKNKSEIIPVGIDFDKIKNSEASILKSKYPIIIWHHRWDEDKNPALFLKLLTDLKKLETSFNLILTVSPTDKRNIYYKKICEQFESDIIFNGFCDTKEDYYNLLNTADVMPIVSNHDFQGLSVIEGLASNIYPILPKHLVYQEYIKEQDAFYYDQYEDLLNQVSYVLDNCPQTVKTSQYVEQYDWKIILQKYISIINSFII